MEVEVNYKPHLFLNICQRSLVIAKVKDWADLKSVPCLEYHPPIGLGGYLQSWVAEAWLACVSVCLCFVSFSLKIRAVISYLTNSWRPVCLGSGEGETWPTCRDSLWLILKGLFQHSDSLSRLWKLNCTSWDAFFSFRINFRNFKGWVFESWPWNCFFVIMLKLLCNCRTKAHARQNNSNGTIRYIQHSSVVWLTEAVDDERQRTEHDAILKQCKWIWLCNCEANKAFMPLKLILIHLLKKIGLTPRSHTQIHTGIISRRKSCTDFEIQV